jgi:hypothetical protein
MTEKFTQSFVLTNKEKEIITEKAREMGDASDSAAFRAITREWSDFKEQERARRYSQPNPLITIEQAQAAAEAMK